MKIMMIVAMDEEEIIGDNEKLPWKLSSDLKRFKQLTIADGFNAVVMGRKTWESLPEKFRPLPERLNIVMSKDTSWFDQGAEVALYPGRAIEIAYANGCDECWIIGGSQIYELFLEHVEEIHLTRVHTKNSGNIKFPTVDWSNWQKEIIEEVKAELGEAGRETDQALVEEIATGKAEWLEEWAPLLNSDEAPINPYRVINEINKAVDHENTILTHDAGHPRDQIMPFYQATAPRGYIGWGKTTHLGYGIPLMIGAKLADPSKHCMNFMGDLAFGHTGLDIETAVRAGVPITTVIINNFTMGGYDKTMPTAMERFGAGNQSGDYADVARALGARGIKVEKPEGIAPALEEAHQANKEGEVCVVEIITRPDSRFSKYEDLLKRD